MDSTLYLDTDLQYISPYLEVSVLYRVVERDKIPTQITEIIHRRYLVY